MALLRAMTLARVVVVGTSGSGKSTMARALASKLGLAHIELDALHWEANWTEAQPDVLRERVARAVGAARWVVDGNYTHLRDLVWERADTVVWLDFARHVVMRRVVLRTLSRTLRREVLWSGNTEPFTRIFTRDSIITWAWNTHASNRAKYEKLLVDERPKHLQVVRLRAPDEAERWLRSLPPRVA